MWMPRLAYTISFTFGALGLFSVAADQPAAGSAAGRAVTSATASAIVRSSAKLDAEAFAEKWKGVSTFEVRDEKGMTPLCQAVSAGNSTLVAYLIDRGADVNLKSGDGRSPLHFAAELDSALVSQLLLRANADHLLRSSTGETPIDVLKRRKLAHADASPDALPNLVRLQMIRALGSSLNKTKQRAARAAELIRLRSGLIEQHRNDQRRLAAQIALYGTTVRARERLFYTVTEVTRPQLPEEFTEDLQLPYPQEEVDLAISSALQTALLAELLYGRNHEMFRQTCSALERLINGMQP